MVATGPGGRTLRPVWGPEPHSGSSYHRPGDEWGTGWTFPIDMAEARINLPEQAAFKQTAFYTGPQGAKGQDARIVEQSPGRIVFRTTKPMPVANGLTVAAAFPKGVVVEPTRMERRPFV